MFEHIEPLQKIKHKELKISPANNYDFARNLTSVPLSYSEIIMASKYYPIVFSIGESPVPMALLALKEAENTFVNKDGKWTVPYIPVHIRRYPFILGRTDDKDNYVVCIDIDAPHFSKDQGKLIYTEKGDLSDEISRTMEILKQYQKEMKDTLRIFKPLLDNELLTDKKVSAGAKDKKKDLIRGFRAVDTDKLEQLDNDILGSWVKQGVMGLVYAHLHSMDNFRKLVS